jgi:5-(carboxyamino)imidazole ribonucleotide synthase
MRIGILGGGQLGQMLMLAAYPLGLETTAYEAKAFSPTALVGNTTIGTTEEPEKLRDWSMHCDVVTYEWENFPAPLVADIAESRPVRPDPVALAKIQDRLFEKRLLADLKIPTSPFRPIDNKDDIETAMSELVLPLIFKTRTGGYDGKGQVVSNEGDDIQAVLELLNTGPLIAEQKLELTKEVSVVGVRALDGTIKTYPVTENEHRNGILHKSTAPASVAPGIEAEAREHVTAILKHLEYIGVMALEMFVVGDRLLANEMAPRVHNSGHWTIEGAEISQFENHIRAVAGLPIGSTELIAPTVMVNLVGAIPDPKSVMKISGAHLHLYGKEPRPGRKVGHITVSAADQTALQQRVEAVESLVNNVLQ